VCPAVNCELCPHRCRISEGKAGICRYRRNEGGRLVAGNYGRVSSSGYDPIEKKPLYHFRPGSTIFSVGTVGCNLGCGFCQNWQISQADAETTYLSPAAAAQLAGARPRGGRQSIGIAFTYSEPVVWWEYVFDTAKAVRAMGLSNVLVTNGFIEPAPLRELLPVIDAMNIDVKSFSDGFYREVCRGKLEPVLRTVEAAHAAGVHVEVTTLLVPGLNDNEAELEALARWLGAIDRGIPLHFSRYFPNYRMTSPPPTPLATMEAAHAVARRHLDFVYLGNVMTDAGADTVCPTCGSVVIRRDGYRAFPAGLEGTGCARCGRPIVRGPAGADVVN
jgi:pyruvate formate lyase activating enzyme